LASGGESAGVQNPTLHELIEVFAVEAAAALAGAAANGEEIPFEVVQSESLERGHRGGVPLYCYRPLTATFIAERAGLLSALSSYAPAARALEPLEGVDAYIRHRGEERIPPDARGRADEALRCLLARVFEDRSEFALDPERFERAYAELERALYTGRCLTVVVAPLLGVALEEGSIEVELGDDLALVRGDALKDAPPEAVWGDSADPARDEPHVLVILRCTQERSAGPPISEARRRFRRLLTALRLLERGGYALGPLAWARVDDGPWRPHPLGASGRPRLDVIIGREDSTDLRSLYGQVARRMPAPSRTSRATEEPVFDTSGSGELTWALSRFEMGCERLAPFEALTDYLLALRALLEPEGPASGRLAGRLAAICAAEEDRGALAERTAHAISLERAVIAGLAPAQPGVDALVDELSDNLRAILRDVLCGHLKVDVRELADELVARAAAG
jgi:hypothetical protein